MADQSRIEDLRRRVERDPASIAFAQLAEEYRRSGESAAAIDTCRAGLALHPTYLSARVTLGRALIEVGSLDEGLEELELVLKSASENLAAIRGVAEVYRRRGDIPRALEYFKSALALARNDPELEETVADLARQITPSRGADPGDGLSFEQIRNVFAQHVPPPIPRPVLPAEQPAPREAVPQPAEEQVESAPAEEQVESAVAPVQPELPAEMPAELPAEIPPPESAPEPRELSEHREASELREDSEPREASEVHEVPELREPAEPREASELREPFEPREPSEPRAPSEPGEPREPPESLIPLQSFLEAIHAARANRRP